MTFSTDLFLSFFPPFDLIISWPKWKPSLMKSIYINIRFIFSFMRAVIFSFSRFPVLCSLDRLLSPRPRLRFAFLVRLLIHKYQILSFYYFDVIGRFRVSCFLPSRFSLWNLPTLTDKFDRIKSLFDLIFIKSIKFSIVLCFLMSCYAYLKGDFMVPE